MKIFSSQKKVIIASLFTLIFQIPSLAVTISDRVSSGSITWGNGTSNFFEDVNPGAGDTFDVTFSPGASALISSATGVFEPFYPAPPVFTGLAPVTGTFEWVANSGVGFIYELQNDLVFNFDNGISVTYGSGEQFLGAFGAEAGVAFEELSTMNASVVVPGEPDVFLLAEELTFGDLAGGSSGEYGASVQATVPEPSTILGLLTAVGITLCASKRKQS